MNDLPFDSTFRPAWWCRNAHMQTLWPYLLRTHPQPHYSRERLELSDGDFLDLDWFAQQPSGPLTLVMHGLEGCSHSHYVRGLVTELAKRGIRSVVMHHRGCSGEPNRLLRSYHAGETTDVATVVQELRKREPTTPIAVVGYSLGGNILLKWLGESAPATVLTAVAVSVPFLLDRGVWHGLSRLYQWRLLGLMRRSARQKFVDRECPVRIDDLDRLRTFMAFDNQITGPLHGFADAQEYYSHCSSRPFLRSISSPVLIIHALDDPMTTADTIPNRQELSPTIRFELSPRGGHVGFVAGPWPWCTHYWLEERIGNYLTKQFQQWEKQ